MEEITYETISTKHPMFQNRSTKIYSGDSLPLELQNVIEVPDSEVLCDGCNQNQYPGDVDAVYLDGRLYDVFCAPCRKRYFPESKEVHDV